MKKHKLKFLKRFARKVVCIVLFSCILGTACIPTALAAESVAFKSVKQTPFIRKDGRQDVSISLTNSGSGFACWAKITVGSAAPYTASIGTVKNGTFTYTLPVTDTHDLLAAGHTTTLKIELYNTYECTGSALAVYNNASWARTRRWEFYLSQQMHTDLGYTAYQEDLKEVYSGYLDTVKQYIDESNNRVTDVEKYKYAIESGFMLGEGYMTRRNADEVAEIVDLTKSGDMTVGAGQFNFTLENMSAEEIARASYYTNRFLVDNLGISPSTTQIMFDNPSFSKSYVDIAASAGIKYGIHSMNPDRSIYNQKKEHDIFYMEGFVPGNKMLIFNGKHYMENYGLGGTHGDITGTPALAESKALGLIEVLEAKSGRTAYPYDKYLFTLVPFADNQRPYDEQIKIANAVNKKWDDAGYAYPRYKSAFPKDFFADLEDEYADLIPNESGTEENWWNDGWGTTAYESGINKEAGALIPVAESAASFASIFMGEKYPYTDINEAMQRNLIYDEHTWGNAAYNDGWQYHNQFEWKRSNGLGAKALADKVLDESLSALSKNVPVANKGIYVHNPLNWVRDDVVTLDDISDLPTVFEIKDGSVSVPYTVKDGVLSFVANNMPALGYKTFEIVEVTEKPQFLKGTNVNGNMVENAFYKVTFAADGTIASIIDKQNGSREMVDSSADVKFNQYQYYDDHGIPFASQHGTFNDTTTTRYNPTANGSMLAFEETDLGATIRDRKSVV